MSAWSLIAQIQDSTYRNSSAGQKDQRENRNGLHRRPVLVSLFGNLDVDLSNFDVDEVIPATLFRDLHGELIVSLNDKVEDLRDCDQTLKHELCMGKRTDLETYFTLDGMLSRSYCNRSEYRTCCRTFCRITSVYGLVQWCDRA